MKLSPDKMTTYIATIKIIIGMLAALSLFLGNQMTHDTQEALLALFTSGYLVFSWLQGFWTNKEMNKPTDAVGGQIETIPDNKEETYAINDRIDQARQMEGREFLDPSEELLSQRRGI